MNDFIISQIRTAVPLLVGALVSWLATKGLKFDAGSTAGVISFLTALFGYTYYLIVRTLEAKFPKFGWLLGVAKKLTYTEQETK